MENEAVKQSLLLKRAPVILNIGLGPGRGDGWRGGPSKPLLVAYFGRTLREVLDSGWRAEVQRAQDTDDEDTLVVAGVFTSDASCSTLLYDCVLRSGQDCIAIWFPESAEGHLFGPRREPWYPFDPEFFKVPSWLTVSEDELQ